MSPRRRSRSASVSEATIFPFTAAVPEGRVYFGVGPRARKPESAFTEN
jgi:hypothetical protein